MLAEYFAQRTDVVCAYLFGSHASGASCPDSDVDVGVLLDSNDRGSLGHMVEIEGDLQAALPGKRVDVVILNEAGLRLCHEIVSTGQVVFERDIDERCDFEVRAMMLYFDWQPIERQFDEAAFVWARCLRHSSASFAS